MIDLTLPWLPTMTDSEYILAIAFYHVHYIEHVSGLVVI